MKEKIKDPIKYSREVVGGDPFAVFLGIIIEEVTEGFARISLPVKPEYLNAHARVHGGLISMMLDHAFAVAAHTLGIHSLTLTMTINYHAGAPAGSTLVVEAQPVDLRRKISTWEIACRTHEDDALVASARGVAYHRV